MKRHLPILTALAILAGVFTACLPVGDTNATPPIRAAFVYNWFGGLGGQGWSQQGLNPFSHYTPTRGFYTSDQATIASQIGDMQYGGLSAGIASWWGQGTFTDGTMGPALAAANGTGFKWSMYYEPSSSSESSIASDLAYIQSHYASNPNWLYINGQPVIFVYTDGSCSDVANWSQANASQGFYTVLRVFPGYASCPDQPSQWHQYGPAVAEDHQPGHSFTISPGYYKANEATPRLARDTATWTQNVKDMVASNEPLQLVTTFNEWGEGTSIENGTAWSSASGYGQYLDVLHNVIGGGINWCGHWCPPPTTTTTTNPGSTTTTTQGSTTTTTHPTTTTTTSPTTTTTSPTTTTTQPSTGGKKVMVIMEENHSQSEFYSGAPYLASLASTYGQATNYKAISHPSLPNYLAIFGGSLYGTSSDCSVGCGPGSSGESVWDATIAAGKSAKAYQESEPSNCDTSGSGAYAPRHGPWPYWTAATPRANCNANDVSLTPLQGDINAGTLPVTGEITPNLNDDAHDGTVAQANTFLQTWVPKLMAGPDYQSGNLTIIIVADEDDGSQSNVVPFVVVNKALSHMTVSGAFNHYSLAKWLDDNAGVAEQNNAASAANLKTAFGL